MVLPLRPQFAHIQRTAEIVYYIYHIPGKKIGVARNLNRRVTVAQGYKEGEYEVLDQSDDIFYISKREIELQKSYGYTVDQTLYMNLFKSSDGMINATEQTSTFPWPKDEMKQNLISHIGLTWSTPMGDFTVTTGNIEWLASNCYKSQFDANKCYIYNKAFSELVSSDINVAWDDNAAAETPNHFELIRQWAQERGIYDKGNVKTQYVKLMEEGGELAKAILKQDQAELVDAIGDCVVVLTNLAHLAGTSIEHCVESAYNEIKNRKGQMSNGTFVKSV